MTDYDVIIIGAGLAGLSAALHLGKESIDILVLEKASFPRHKVCGEYVSNEVRPYFESMGVVFGDEYPEISSFRLQTETAKDVSCELPLGGFGISRFTLDQLLYEKAVEKGVQFQFDSVEDVVFRSNSFFVKTKSGEYTSKFVLGCFGKRSLLDKRLNRKFIQRKSPWLGIKAHYYTKEFPKNLVALGTFEGGYGGLSMIEKERVNFCYLVSYESFQKIGDIEEFNSKIVSKNPMFHDFFSNAELTEDFKKPISISQISFDKKRAVEDHMLMCGDSAGLIHPLCGNGMAMAVSSAKLASEAILNAIHFQQKRNIVEETYAKNWQNEFSMRLWFGRKLQHLFLQPLLLENGIRFFGQNSRLVPYLISKTHGKQLAL